MSDWQSFSIKLPGQELLEPVRNVLETLMIFLEIIKTILQTVEIFLIDFGNPVRALLQALLALVNTLFESLKQTGLFAWFDVPNPMKDPNFHRNVGGYQAFTDRFKGSLFDSKDPNRPQPVSGANQSGFVLLVADAETVYAFLAKLGVLMRFFGKELTQPMYAPPTNAKISLANSRNQPLIRLRDVFSSPPSALVLEWGLSESVSPPDPGFTDLASQVGSTFIPQKFLIEKSTAHNGEPLISSLATNFDDKNGKKITRQVQAVDQYGDPVRVYQQYIEVPVLSTAGFIGQLTKFRYIDSDIEKDKTYYYRIRAFSGDLKLSGTSLSFKAEEDPQSKEFVARWPANNPSEPPVMGRPTPVLSGRIPTLPPAFDVLGLLASTFKAGFSLGFHLEAAPDAKFDPSSGLPIGTTENNEIGRGSLRNLSGPVSTHEPIIFSTPPLPDSISDRMPDLTWQIPTVKFKAADLANTVANALLENSDSLTGFRSFMQGPLQYPLQGGEGYIDASVTTPEKLIVALTTAKSDYKTVRDRAMYETASFAYSDPNVRLNVLSILNYIKSFTLGGNPPDWQSISIFRDIIPWSGALIYEILAKVDGLLDAFKGALDEIKAFIDLLIKKIEVLERFLQFLTSILDLLLSFEAGFYILNASGLSSLQDWIQTIDQAGGDKPASGPGGYTGGIALAYVAPDVTAFQTAFNILF